MKYFYTLLTASFMSGLLLTTQLSAAEETTRFQEHGKIDAVNAKEAYLIVDDSKLMLSPGVKVYSPSGALLSVGALKPGMKITFNLGAQKINDRDVITEMAVFPNKK